MAQSPELPVVGDIFEGRWEILEVRGRGGFAIVYRAHDNEVHRDVAIKVLLPKSRGYSNEVSRRFLREAKVVANLQNPHLIKMFDFGTSATGLLYMVFEFIDGEDLETRLRQGPLPHEAVKHILMQILEGLTEAHQAGILHRDIKPPNIVLYEYDGDPYRAKLIDFGIALPDVGRTAEPTKLTAAGMVMGTPRYMAPEQLFGESLTAVTDIYCLGLVAHEMLAGRPAVVASDPAEVIGRQISGEPFVVPAHTGPASLRLVIDRMTSYDPANRPQPTSAVLQMLRAIRREELADVAETAPRTPLQGRPGYVRMPDVGPPSVQRDPGAVTLTVDDEPQSRTKLAIAVLSCLVVLLTVLVAYLGISRTNKPVIDTQEPTKIPDVTAELVGTLEPKMTAVTGASKPPKETPNPAEAEAEPTPDQPVTGCGAAPPRLAITSYSMTIDSTQRSWAVYVPRGYEPTVQHPVVLMFHRTGRDGRQFIEESQIATQANAYQFLAISFDPVDPDTPWIATSDAAFVHEAVMEMNRTLCLDLSRVYTLGDGAGGRMARNLPCILPISAAAETGSGVHPDETICAPSTPTPHIRLYGTKDKDIPIAGGNACGNRPRPFVSAREIELGWRKRNGCTGGKRVWTKHSGGQCVTYGDCRAPFVHCGMDGGHDWPEFPAPIFKWPDCVSPPPQFPIGETIWRFFEEHGRLLPPDAFGEAQVSR